MHLKFYVDTGEIKNLINYNEFKNLYSNLLQNNRVYFGFQTGYYGFLNFLEKYYISKVPSGSNFQSIDGL